VLEDDEMGGAVIGTENYTWREAASLRSWIAHWPAAVGRELL